MEHDTASNGPEYGYFCHCPNPVTMSSDNLENMLPYDGEVYYFKDFAESHVARNYYKAIDATIRWENEQVRLFGKNIVMNRKVAWYGDRPYVYAYSGQSRTALCWNSILKEIKLVVEQRTGERFNSCLLNLYPKGSDGMGWHSDDEKELEPLATIASLSLGSERKFSFRHRISREVISLDLAHGSLLLMKDVTQKHWQHQLHKTKKDVGPRINLTFRSMSDDHENM